MNAFRVYFKDEIEVCIWWGVFFNVLLNLFYKCFIDTFSPMFVKVIYGFLFYCVLILF